MYHSKIHVTLRKSILDPQGKTVEHGIHSLGYESVNHVRMGKYVELDVNTEKQEEAERITREVCERLLANPVMEDFHFSIEQSASSADK